MSCTFVMYSDYLKDLHSYCFVEQDDFCTRFMGEFNSRTAQLELTFNKENNEEGILC